MDNKTLSNGKLIDKFLPAIYFDTSVVIDYWLTEGMEINDDFPETNIDILEKSYGQLAIVVRRLLQSDKRVRKVVELRKRIMFDEIKFTPVTSHIALWELQEWIAESSFKQMGSEIEGAIFPQKKGKKEIGNYLKKAYDLWKDEGKEKHHDSVTGTSGLEILMQDTWLNLSFAHFHGLNGIMIPEIKNFCWPPKGKNGKHITPDPLGLAYFQLGIADIFHLLMANHLGCRYLASFDSDFHRIRDFMEEMGITLLTTPEEIISIM